MIKLYCITGYKTHEDAPIVNGHQAREMILEEAKDFSEDDVDRLMISIRRLKTTIENVYRINPVNEAAKEFKDTLYALNSDNIEGVLTLDRRFRSYTMEFDMFLDYWESYIAHHKKMDKDGNFYEDIEAIQNYKKLFDKLTHDAYDKHTEYQLIDLIRNQIAHVQSPVNHVHVGINGNEAYSNRDVLLKNCRSGKNKKKYLKSLTKIYNGQFHILH